MAELAALGAAAAIAQFVDLALRWTAQAKEVLQSADGLSKTNTDFRIIAADVAEQSALLLSSSAIVTSGSSLANLLKQCTQVAAELTKELKWLQIDPASARKRDRARALWRALVDKDAIPQLERRLSSLRDEVCFNIITALENHQRSLIRSAASIKDSTREWNLATNKKLNAMAHDLKDGLKVHSSKTTAMFSSLATELRSYSDQSFHRSRVEAILKSLRFEHIRERESRVEIAHKATLHWVFDQQSPVNLGAWLRTGNGTYWIEGKAGSGKSTMMKFVLQHQETSRLLQQWANDKELFIGSHFFWTMGTDLQKTQIGLLRTMLFQLLKRHPDLIAVACPDRLSIKNFEHLDSWTMESLAQAFRLLLACKHLAIRMCFFIDGLDEYSGIHTDLVQLLDSFAKSDYIKLCVSSRPWPEFREAYGAMPYRLCIHEFTRPDIYAFAHGRLTENPQFEVLRENSGEEADRLVDDISTRAEGVFLWVYYVVRSLLRGLSNRDDIHVLRTRLQQFPQELTAFFKHMFSAIDSVYKPQAAMLLKMLAAYDQPIPVFPLVIADLEARDRDKRAKEKGVGAPMASARYLYVPFGVPTYEHEREILTGRCKDLIHAVNMGEPGLPVAVWDIRIGFLHRTVSDFINTSEMVLVLAPFLDHEFHPHVQLLHGFALAAERTLRDAGFSMLDELDESNPAPPTEGGIRIGQCARAVLFDVLRLAKHIHDGGDVSSMKKARPVFERFSSFWNLIFPPPKSAKHEYSTRRAPGDPGRVVYPGAMGDKNHWIAQDLHKGPKIPLSEKGLLTLDRLSRQELVFRPENIWQLLGALGLTGYVTACFIPDVSSRSRINVDPDSLRIAREMIYGAFSRQAVLLDSEEEGCLRYTERWNTDALSVLLSWWALQPSAEQKMVDVLWEAYHLRMLMLGDYFTGPAIPTGFASLDMAKVLVANGVKRHVPVPDWILVENYAALSPGTSPALPKALEGLVHQYKKSHKVIMDSFILLDTFFSRDYSEAIKDMFHSKVRMSVFVRSVW